MRVIDPEQIAWAAGIYEGEGSVGTSIPKKQIRLRVTMTDFDIIERFHRVVGVGRISVKKKPAGYKPQLEFCTNRFEEVQVIIAMLWNHLCERRRQQATTALLAPRQWPRRRPKHWPCDHAV